MRQWLDRSHVRAFGKSLAVDSTTALLEPPTSEVQLARHRCPRWVSTAIQRRALRDVKQRLCPCPPWIRPDSPVAILLRHATRHDLYGFKVEVICAQFLPGLLRRQERRIPRTLSLRLMIWRQISELNTSSTHSHSWRTPVFIILVSPLRRSGGRDGIQRSW